MIDHFEPVEGLIKCNECVHRWNGDKCISCKHFIHNKNHGFNHRPSWIIRTGEDVYLR